MYIIRSVIVSLDFIIDKRLYCVDIIYACRWTVKWKLLLDLIMCTDDRLICQIVQIIDHLFVKNFSAILVLIAHAYIIVYTCAN